MSEKENILARVREALKSPAPPPGSHDAHAPKGETSDSSRRDAAKDYSQLNTKNWLPKVGGTFDEHLSLFRQNALDLKTDFVLLDGESQLAAHLAKMRDTEGWKKIGSHKGQLAAIACRALDLPLVQTDEPYKAEDLESCDAGITECDALIAQTGSVLVTARSAGGRALSVLPPHHMVIARREQLLPDLPAAFALIKKKYSENYPSFISLITGPSRTGDIERILVLGAHGPKKLTILCI